MAEAPPIVPEQMVPQASMEPVVGLDYGRGRLLEADRRKDEFLATLAHELRNLLSPVVHSMQILKMANPGLELVESVLPMMERQMCHMTRLVDDLLDVNRLARNQLALKPKRIELGRLLEEAVEASRISFEAAGRSLTILPLPEPVYLEGDADRLTQVFGNLLSNACKFTEPGGRIQVSLEPQGSDVVVRIADSGIGISPQFLTRIFERFVQVGHPSERGGGLGIGLGLAKQLVELHGGTITANSRGLGQGSEFVVRLPILIEPNERFDSGPAAEPQGPTPARRILLVDDSPDAVESLALLLGLAGHQTAIASTGLAAITLAETYRPEVILLDIGLPGMSGYDVCRAIRATPWGQTVMVIALTGWGHEEERRRTAEAGFTAHLVKPVDWSRLALLLSQARPT